VRSEAGSACKEMSMGKFHFTKGTVEASCWCNVCKQNTSWRILNGKRAYCIPCYDKPSKPVEKQEESQFDLFRKDGP
jgi:hypothetical protein